MAEPLKNVYSPEFVGRLVGELKSVWGTFDGESFTNSIFDADWEGRELKDRMGHIAVNLRRFLPDEYEEALEILKQVAPRFEQGFECMFFPDFVEKYGINQYDESIVALEVFTQYSSSEFAVRPFIMEYPKRMMGQMKRWARSKNHHVRRLASEGCRPRLPWAMALPVFKKDPEPVIEILETLRGDESEYVRRSVANNLNDISKDHPNRVMEIAGEWLGNSPETDGVVKHACRTLLKAGDSRALALFGYAAPEGIALGDLRLSASVPWEGALEFEFALTTKRGDLGRLRIEYGIDYLKKNGKRSRKVFKISESEVAETEKRVQRTQSFRSISTRRHYPGVHGLAIIVNGQELGAAEFVLESPSG